MENDGVEGLLFKVNLGKEGFANGLMNAKRWRLVSNW